MNADLHVRCAQLAERLAGLSGEVDALVRDAYTLGYASGLDAAKSGKALAPASSLWVRRLTRGKPRR